MTRKILLCAGVVLACGILLLIVFSAPRKKADSASTIVSTSTEISNSLPVGQRRNFPLMPEFSAIASSTYRVLRVVDGDTIKVDLNGATETVRLIGIDAPETVHPTKPVQCFGPEATAEIRRLLVGGSVRLEEDASQGERDKYGRLLAYVFLPDGTDVDGLMVWEGFAREYTYNLPYKYQTKYRAAQTSARSEGRGLWSACQGR